MGGSEKDERRRQAYRGVWNVISTNGSPFTALI
jgi:hypothetical protein